MASKLGPCDESLAANRLSSGLDVEIQCAEFLLRILKFQGAAIMCLRRRQTFPQKCVQIMKNRSTDAASPAPRLVFL
jgi:hypothetical protein